MNRPMPPDTPQPVISDSAVAMMIRARHDDGAMPVAVQQLLASLNVNLQAPMRERDAMPEPRP